MVRSAAQDPASGALARDLMVKLGTLQSVQSASVQLISEADAKSVKPDLVLEVAPTSGDSAGANLLIKRRANGAILWSQDFEKDTGNLADFKQQITYTAARVVGCAGEGVDPRRGRIDDETLKLYINSCARFAEITVTGPDAVVASLRQVVKKAPEFSVAWEKLLLAELALVDTAREAGNDLGPLETRLRADIASARKFEPQMPEAILAQLAFVPPEDVATRMQIADRAKEADPTDPAVLHKRSIELQRVGRMREGIDDAQRALELDPLSPDAHGLYFGSLLYAGNIDGAQQEIQAVERLWPSSSTARDLEGRFNLRKGDPRKALPEAQRLGLGGMVKMLEARIDPAKIRPYIDWLLSRRDYESGRLGVMIQGMAQFHYEDELYRTLFSWPNPDDIARMQDLWFRPWLHEFRRDPRFIRIMARTQLLKYWRTTGHWPDFCFEPDLPYDCRKEAARLGA
jgi:tetratricopeptide (TPR) repeat protein